MLIAGGALMTPRLLMFSGIGPSATLKKFGITSIYTNENVGKNMRNHWLFEATWQGTNVTYPNMENIQAETINFGLHGQGFFATSPEITAVQVQLTTLPGQTDADIVVLVDWITDTLFSKPVTFILSTTTPTYMNGTVTINSTNPLDLPLYTHPAGPNAADTATIVRGLQKLRTIMAQPAAKAYFGNEIAPGANYSSTAALTTWVENNSFLVFHYYGTCKMGNTGDSLRVVDPNLRVVGVNNLRIIDSSVIPGVVHAVIQAAVVGVAEKGASIILNEYGYGALA